MAIRLVLSDRVIIVADCLNNEPLTLHYIPYSGLFSRGKIFTNYPNPNIQGENFHELSQSKYSRGKFSRIVKRCDIIIILRACVSRMETHEVESAVRGYHIYKDIWSAAVGSTLSCRQERFNPHDSYAVAVIKDDVVVGHVPRNISVAYLQFFTEQ